MGKKRKKEKKMHKIIVPNIGGANRIILFLINNKKEILFLLKKIEVIKYPEITKKRSTPRYPFGVLDKNEKSIQKK